VIAPRCTGGVHAQQPSARQVWTDPPAAPPPPGWTAPPLSPPLGWGVPQSAAWARQPPQSNPAPLAATVGDTLSSTSPTGETVSITLVEVVDTADALIAAAGHPLSAGMRATVVHTEVAGGPTGYQAVPDTCLTVVLGDGAEVGKAGIVLNSRPPFRRGVAAGETVGGHTVFEVDAQAGIVGNPVARGPRRATVGVADGLTRPPRGLTPPAAGVRRRRSRGRGGLRRPWAPMWWG